MRSIIATAVLCAVFIGYPARAQDSAQTEATRIEIDQKAKAFIFIIDNEPVAMLDQAGLHVVGQINYGATLTDTGKDSVEKHIADQAEVADD